MTSVRKWLTILFISIPIAACSDGGSMRIGVDVYNGPLSRDLEIQKAELRALVQITHETMALMIREFHLSQCSLGCFGSNLDRKNLHRAALNYCAMSHSPIRNLKQYTSTINPKNSSVNSTSVQVSKKKNPSKTSAQVKIAITTKSKYSATLADAFSTPRNQTIDVKDIFPKNVLAQYPYMFPVKKKWNNHFYFPVKEEDEPRQICPVLSDLKTAMMDIYMAMDNSLLNKNERKTPDKYAITAALFGQTLSEGAEQWAVTQTAILPESRRLRIVVARASMAAVELGNEISARADAIIKQKNGDHPSNLLASSLYLRNSEGTDYLNLVDWMDARPPRDNDGWSATDRTRMVERLISDANWSKVNEAFAQGRGKVNMVFVKDDIGNWNLKSYDNDPSEILKAYTNIGTTLLTTATSLIAPGKSIDTFTKQIAGVKKANAAANEILLGAGESTSATTNTVTAIENRVKNRLLSAVGNLEKVTKNLKVKLEDKDAEVKTLKAQKDNQQSDFEASVKSRNKAKDDVTAKQAAFNKEKDKYLALPDAEKPLAFKDLNDKKTILTLAKDELEKTLEDTSPTIDNYNKIKAEHTTATEALEAIKTKLDDAPQHAMTRIEEILKGHAEMLEGLQESIIKAQ